LVKEYCSENHKDRKDYNCGHLQFCHFYLIEADEYNNDLTLAGFSVFALVVAPPIELEPMTSGDVSRNIPSFLFAEGSSGRVLSKPNQDVEEKL